MRIELNVRMLDVSVCDVDAWYIVYPSSGVDPVEVFWRNIEPGVGSVTITCYGSAWTAYFGAMSGRTIQDFFMSADDDYLVTKLGISTVLRNRKKDLSYLRSVIWVVKDGLKEMAKAGAHPK